jgi:chromosomal replication initiation ATPase DnaA
LLKGRLFSPQSLAYADDLFIIDECNAIAYEWLENWPKHCSNFATFLKGPPKSGKKHLTHKWLKENNGIFLESIKESVILPSQNCIAFEIKDCENQEDLFHFFNAAQQQKKNILFISQKSVQDIATLNDLKSRLHTAHYIEILEPDESFIQKLYNKLFNDFGILVSSEVLQYLMLRADRSFKETFNTVKKLDEMSLAFDKRLTIPFIKKILEF